MPEVPPPLITYCTNIHRGESWAETFAALRRHLPAVKAAVSPQRPFPVGLRLSARAAGELTPAAAAGFAGWLAAHDCFVPTLNGFPFGPFHGMAVKAAVYRPDWRARPRVDYTLRLAELLAGWLPPGLTGSISTVPVGFRAHLQETDLPRVRQNLLDVLHYLSRLRQRKDVDIVLALEPEPGCLLEATTDLPAFMARMDFPPAAAAQLGVCLDCCHLALAFEEPAAALANLRAAGIRLGKVQATAALRLRGDRRQALRPFADPVYLHQVTVRGSDGRLARYDDLPQALALHRGGAAEDWRCHCHVPLFWAGNGDLQTTRGVTEEVVKQLPPGTLLETETYTWEVLPPALRQEPVAAAIVRELRWLRERVDAPHRRP